MEFAKLGDLQGVLERLAIADRHLPPEALWLVFDCLVKACIAMEYPTRLVPAAGPEPPDGDLLPEVVPPGGLAGQATGFRGYVHFDLDPNNSMLCCFLSTPPLLLGLETCAELLEIFSISIRIRPPPQEQSPESPSYASAEIPGEY